MTQETHQEHNSVHASVDHFAQGEKHACALRPLEFAHLVRVRQGTFVLAVLTPNKVHPFPVTGVQ